MGPLINLDVTPFCPSNMRIAPESEQIASRARGKFCPLDVRHYSLEHNNPERLRSRGTVREIMEELACDNVPVLSANVLWWFLSNTNMIHGLKPCGWGAKRHCPTLNFFGTIYVSAEGFQCVLGLKWLKHHEDWCYTVRYLDDTWEEGIVAIPAAG